MIVCIIVKSDKTMFKFVLNLKSKLISQDRLSFNLYFRSMIKGSLVENLVKEKV